MTRNIYTITSEDSIAEAFDLMKETNVRHLPVVDPDEQLMGILSERDLLLRANYDSASGEIDFPELTVADAMVTDIVSCTPMTSIADVAAIFVKEKIDCMPVLDSHSKLVGLITSSDILAIMGEVDGSGRKNALPFKFKLNARSGLEKSSKSRPWS
jgi:acetoin utilization protein AcuB